ncbi:MULTISPECIES: ornithine carbamoyltransferase [Rhodomicrobium]|uniref:ornithine carbamoyltransferase n=1 Tax=Rhodomicrobium TaxID=1068 RepID=UPI000B4A6118|nr:MULTISPECIES: ornithine carbamoyltransferase [Rhodomicrobium]
MAIRHFLDIEPFDRATLEELMKLAHAMKADLRAGGAKYGQLAAGKMLVMMFEKPSTRTRVSFDVAMRKLGGESIVLNSTDMQLGRGETIADTARVLSRYVDVLMLRSTSHANLVQLAAHADVPVINGLTDHSHPCQIFADIMTFEEKIGPVANRVITWVGDAANNVATSWIHAAARFNFTLHIGAPASLQPAKETLDWAAREGARLVLFEDPRQAVAGADCIVTDVWISMGQKDEDLRLTLLKDYQVNAALMKFADPDAIFMHCLPAQRGREVTDEVIDGPQSVVFDEAENRVHAQRAILAWCLEKT